MKSITVSGSEDVRTIYQVIRNAYAVQHDSDLRSVIAHFQRDLARLVAILNVAAELNDIREVSLSVINQHPLARLYGSYIQSLTHGEALVRHHDAYVWCEHMLNQESFHPTLPSSPPRNHHDNGPPYLQR